MADHLARRGFADGAGDGENLAVKAGAGGAGQIAQGGAGVWHKKGRQAGRQGGGLMGGFHHDARSPFGGQTVKGCKGVGARGAP